MGIFGIFSSLMKKKTRCHKCGRTLYSPRVKPQSTIASGTDHRIWEDERALECTSCKKISCNACARKASQAIGESKPICPSCSGSLR
jgi:hypothetical protein